LKVIIVVGGSLALAATTFIAAENIEAHHTIKPRTPTRQAVSSPAQLTADEAAYEASAVLVAQLCNTYDRDNQAEQTALDTYGDTSTQYQRAKATTDKAHDACFEQTQDATSKSLQVTMDGGTPSTANRQ